MNSYSLGHVHPIELPPSNFMLPRTYEEGTIVGFGMIAQSDNPAPNKTPKTVYLMTAENNACTSAYPVLNMNLTFCAIDEIAESMNVCHGDVGSAFITSFRGRNVLVK